MKFFRDELRKKSFVITAECFLKPETDAESIRLQAETLRDYVDAVVLTDNQFGRTHMNTIAAARLMLDSGVDPIVQLSCRNRNRIALVAELLGASALGVSSLLLIQGNKVPQGIMPRPKAVRDVSLVELIGIATRLKEDGNLKDTTNLLIGTTMMPHVPGTDWVPEKLTRKIDAGAQFLFAHAVFDIDTLRQHINRLIAERLTRRASIIASTVILTSADDARWLRDNRPNVTIPDAVVHRLETASDPQEEGLRICAEHLSQLARTPGISGANIIASTDLAMIPAIIDAADLTGVETA